MAYALQHRPNDGQVVTASGLDVLAGIWLLISPFVLAFSTLTTAMTNDVVCGAVVIILAAIRFGGALRQSWLSWINCLIGIWVIISPWVLGFAHHAGTLGLAHNQSASTNNVIIGIVIAVLAFWSAAATSAAETSMTDRPDVDRM